MKKGLKLIAGVILPLFILSTISTDSYAAAVQVMNGTPVVLKLMEEVSSKTKNLNDVVNFQVSRDVVINNQIVIKAGTPATGTVTSIEKPAMIGKPGKVQISIDSTKSVDGKRVSLRSTLNQTGSDKTALTIVLTIVCCVLFLLMKGDDFVMPVGSEAKSYTDSDVTVDVN